MSTSIRSKQLARAAKVIGLTVVTMGIYGAYWAMTGMFEEDDIDADETQKDADYMKRSAASAFLSRFFTGI